MGNLFLYGQTAKKEITDLFAKLTVYCQNGMTVRVKSVSSSVVFEKMTDDTGTAVFEHVVPGYWDITVPYSDNPPVKRIRIDSLEYSVSLDQTSATIDIIYPRGSTCIVRNGNRTYYAPDDSGFWSCVVYDTGVWTVTSSDGDQTASTRVNVSHDGDIVRVNLKYFESTINVMYPVGSTCVISDGNRTYYAPDVSGSWTCKVPNTGEWTVSSSNDDLYTSKTVNIIADGQSLNVELKYLAAVINVTYPSGSTCTITNGDKYYTAPDTSGAWSCVVNGTGTWTITAINGDRSASTSIEIVEDEQISSVTLRYFTATIRVNYPAGSTCTISNGSKDYYATDTSGYWNCSVTGSGTWTVTCTDGEQTASSIVDITYNGQVSIVSLTYFDAFINVTYPVGAVCTITDGDIIYTAPDTSGGWSCTVTHEGPWFITVTKDGKTYSSPELMAEEGCTYTVNLPLPIEATINVTYPVGAMCMITDGVVQIDAPDTSGFWSCTVDHAGEWYIVVFKDDMEVYDTVYTETDGSTHDVVLSFPIEATINVMYPAYSSCAISKDDIVYYAPDDSGYWSCPIYDVGTWVVSCTDGERTISNNVEIVEDGQIISTTLSYIGSYINITYTEGASCKVWKYTSDDHMHSTLVGEAPDTSGRWTFIVPEEGVYSIDVMLDIDNDGSVYNDDEWAFRKVTITGPNEVIDVMVMLSKDRTYLFYYGDQCENITGGWGTYREGATNCYLNGSYIWFEVPSMDTSGYAYVYANNSVNLDNYSRIIVEVDTCTVADTYGMSTAPEYGINIYDAVSDLVIASAVYESQSENAPFDIYLDISNITGNCYLELFSQFVNLGILQVYLV